MNHAGMKLELPNGVTLFDVDVNENGSALFFLATPWGRDILALGPGDDLVGRFQKLLEDMMKAKEIGMSPKASKKAKAYDEKMDKKMGYKEGSKADIKADKAAMKKFPVKKVK